MAELDVADGVIRVDPYLVALLVCERVIKEEGTGSETLVGVFSEILASSLPSTKLVAVYAKLTDAEGPYTFRLQYVHVQSDQLLAQLEYQADVITDRLRYYQLVFSLPISIDQEGAYEFRLFANGAYLSRIGFNVRQVEQEGA